MYAHLSLRFCIMVVLKLSPAFMHTFLCIIIFHMQKPCWDFEIPMSLEHCERLVSLLSWILFCIRFLLHISLSMLKAFHRFHNTHSSSSSHCWGSYYKCLFRICTDFTSFLNTWHVTNVELLAQILLTSNRFYEILIGPSGFWSRKVGSIIIEEALISQFTFISVHAIPEKCIIHSFGGMKKSS